MANIYLDVWCPKCNSEDISGEFDDFDNKIICKCKNCGYSGTVNNFYYTVEELFEIPLDNKEVKI